MLQFFLKIKVEIKIVETAWFSEIHKIYDKLKKGFISKLSRTTLFKESASKYVRIAAIFDLFVSSIYWNTDLNKQMFRTNGSLNKTVSDRSKHFKIFLNKSDKKNNENNH